MTCCCGYLSGTRCKLFTYGPAIAIPKPYHLLPHLNRDWFYLSGAGLPRCLGKEAVKRVYTVVVVVVIVVVVVVISGQSSWLRFCLLRGEKWERSLITLPPWNPFH